MPFFRKKRMSRDVYISINKTTHELISRDLHTHQVISKVYQATIRGQQQVEITLVDRQTRTIRLKLVRRYLYYRISDQGSINYVKEFNFANCEVYSFPEIGIDYFIGERFIIYYSSRTLLSYTFKYPHQKKDDNDLYFQHDSKLFHQTATTLYYCQTFPSVSPTDVGFTKTKDLKHLFKDCIKGTRPTIYTWIKNHMIIIYDSGFKEMTCKIIDVRNPEVVKSCIKFINCINIQINHAYNNMLMCVASNGSIPIFKINYDLSCSLHDNTEKLDIESLPFYEEPMYKSLMDGDIYDNLILSNQDIFEPCQAMLKHLSKELLKHSPLIDSLIQIIVEYVGYIEPSFITQSFEYIHVLD